MHEPTTTIIPTTLYTDRDISWLSFNERVLLEASGESVRLLEKIKFLAIYSSNLDEFYRVRIPALTVLKKLSVKKDGTKKAYREKLAQLGDIIYSQQQQFGTILTQQILPELEKQNIEVLYNKPIPQALLPQVAHYFYSNILAYIKVLELTGETSFFTENNKLYLFVDVKDNEEQRQYIVNIPSDEMPRFYSLNHDGKQYVIFIDDIIKLHLSAIFKGHEIEGAYSVKITRDAALEFDDEYDEDLAQEMEKKIAKRDFGLATRLLYDGNLSEEHLKKLTKTLRLRGAIIMQGGRYHNLKDLASLPVHNPALENTRWPALPCTITQPFLLDKVAQEDILIHTPYQSYDTVLRFFNEVSVNPDAEEIFVTLYRVAEDSRIGNALISAAANGKKVTVIIELKARFDETNNLKWTKKLREAGVTILHSVPSLKVHAKIALVKFREGYSVKMLGLLATGNLNEGTARFYTDYILLTAHQGMLAELEQVFAFLSKKKKPEPEDHYDFKHLLVAQFNLLDKFRALIDREISNAKSGLPAVITIKLNNLEETGMIDMLYRAAAAGVTVKLIVRGICRLVPHASPNITVRRIVDRYLEHGRVFIFDNNGNEEVYLGSADWMSRNIYRRIEVCFPIHDVAIKNELKQIINIQLDDVYDPVTGEGEATRSQQKIYSYLSSKT